MLMISFLGVEKLTARWLRSLTSLPGYLLGDILQLAFLERRAYLVDLQL